MVTLPKFSLALAKYSAISLIVLILGFILFNSWYVLDEINFEEKENAEFVSDFKYFVDKSNQLTFTKIQHRKDEFTSAKMQDIPYDLADETYWLTIDIASHANEKQALVLYADNSLLDVFDVYQKNYKDQYDHINLVRQPKSLLNAYPHIVFTLPKASTQHFLIKIKTDGPPNVPLMILSEADFQQRIAYAQMVYGAFIGIILLMALYNVVLYFAIKDKVYLVYIGYLLSAFFVLASLTGFGYLIFSYEVQTIINQYLLFNDYYLVIFLLAFTLLFLRYEQTKGKTYQLGIILSVVLFICSIYSLSLDTIAQTKLFFSLQPAVYIFALLAISRRIKTDFSWAKFYLLSWVPLLIGAAIQPLVLLNYLDYSFLTRNAFLFAIMAEVTLMAFALAERMKRNEQDRLHDIVYHLASGLPRKSNIDHCIAQLINNGHTNFSVLIIKPDHIDQIALYIDDKMNTELFKHLYQKLASLFNFNDAVCSLTDKQEKLCFLNNNSLALVVDNEKSLQPLTTLIQSVQQIVSDNFQLAQLKIPLTAVVGVANFPEHGKASHLLLNHTQLALTQAELNHEKWSLFQSISSDKTAYLLNLAAELNAAIESNQLEIYHQPQIDLKTLRVCSSECLLRWKNTQGEFIPPTVFVPLAEDMGLINRLTLWVIKRSLAQQLQLSEENGYNHMVSINISGKDLSSKHFFSDVLDIIEHSNIAAEKIIFELTESASFSDNQQAIDVINKLTELGLTISIDDFGTGYSSMSQVSNLPFQELKVDRQFVENVCQDKKRKIIAKATVEMAKGLGLEVVAEGINSQEDEDTLRQFGCDIGQGFYYAKPMSLNDYIDWLARLTNGRIPQSIQGEFIPADK